MEVVAKFHLTNDGPESSADVEGKPVDIVELIVTMMDKSEIVENLILASAEAFQAYKEEKEQ
jgi:hypothetical protein